MTDLKAKVREVQDFPTPGVGFKDVTPLLADPQLLRETVGGLAEWVRSKDADIVLADDMAFGEEFFTTWAEHGTAEYSARRSPYVNGLSFHRPS